ncbi:MAG: hypothetical protein ACYDBA_12105 [Sulfuricaulis sp.]
MTDNKLQQFNYSRFQEKIPDDIQTRSNRVHDDSSHARDKQTAN